jgi:hypothetical protein
MDTSGSLAISTGSGFCPYGFSTDAGAVCPLCPAGTTASPAATGTAAACPVWVTGMQLARLAHNGFSQ